MSDCVQHVLIKFYGEAETERVGHVVKREREGEIGRERGEREERESEGEREREEREER